MKTYVWTLTTRLFHWLMVIALVSAFILGETEGNLNYHTAFGYLAACLIFFRIIWGFAGPKYSRFSDFPIGFGSIREFFTNMKASKQKHMGHNPAASLVMLGIIITVLLLACSGMLALAAEGAGPLAFLNLGDNETFEEMHEVFVKILVVLVILHFIGLAADKLFHGDNGTLFSMFTGYKTKSGEPANLTTAQKVFSVLFIVIPLIAFLLGAAMQNLEENEDAPGSSKLEQHDDD